MQNVVDVHRQNMTKKAEDEEDEEDEEEEEEEEELEVFEFTYDGKMYYATDTTSGTLYENLDGEVGDEIGSLRKGVPFLC